MILRFFYWLSQRLINIYTRIFIYRLLEASNKTYPPIYQGFSSVRRLTATTILKQGPSSKIRGELEAMRLVALHTTIPIPKVHDSWFTGDKGFIVMEYIDATNLPLALNTILTSPQRRHVATILEGYVKQLQGIPQPSMPGLSTCSGWIGSAGGGAVWDPYLSSADMGYGPFATQREFNDFRTSLYEPNASIHTPTLARLKKIRQAIRDDHPVVFTHADIHKGNVMIRVHGEGDEDVEVVALLDWGCAGWRPIFWEGLKLRWLGGRVPAFNELAMRIYADFEEDVDREIMELCMMNSGMPP